MKNKKNVIIFITILITVAMIGSYYIGIIYTGKEHNTRSATSNFVISETKEPEKIIPPLLQTDRPKPMKKRILNLMWEAIQKIRTPK
jgi:flagellar basal body-associated protein FliL